MRKFVDLTLKKYDLLSHELKSLAGRVFCKRKVIVISEKGISSIPVSSKLQGLVTMCVLLVLLWISYSTGKYVTYENVISEKDRQIWNTNVANEGLQYQMADLHQNLSDLNRYFEDIRSLGQVASIGPIRNTKRKDIDSDDNYASFSAVDSAKQTGDKSKKRTEDVQKILSSIRSKVLTRINSLEGIIGKTGLNLKKIAESNVSLGRAMTNAPHLRAQTNSINTDKSISRNNRNQGGPYQPISDGMLEDKTSAQVPQFFNQDEFEAEINYLMQLERFVGTIPLSAPLKSYGVSSGFGRRIDPIHNTPAIHTGIDLSGGYKSKVYSSAPGVVVYADNSGAYGLLVQVDHGSGISTWYGHLDRILVREGDAVKLGQLVGLQGNTGRSTGTHLHYEVRINNQPVDPANFLEAGRYVF